MAQKTKNYTNPIAFPVYFKRDRLAKLTPSDSLKNLSLKHPKYLATYDKFNK